jgi:superfamily II DNA or RNA helicase
LFLTAASLLENTWQGFERNVARLLMHLPFDEVRMVGRTGDAGADIIAVRGGKKWVIQCKHTTTSTVRTSAIEEVLEAGRFYDADELVLALSQPASVSLWNHRRNHRIPVRIWEPRDLLNLVTRAGRSCYRRRTLREYQGDAVQRMLDVLQDRGKGHLALATGLGKTVILAEVVAEMLQRSALPNRRVLVLAHTRTLVQQLHRDFWYQLPSNIPTGQLMHGERLGSWDQGVVFATVQSVQDRVHTLPHVDMVVVDEAHHGGANTYVDLLRRMAPAYVAGATATPWRSDGFDLSIMFGPPLMKMGIAEGLQHGYLSEVDYRLLGDNLDWEYIQDVSRHGYSIRQLNRKLIIPTRDDEAARAIRRVFDQEGRRSLMVFSPSLVHAKSFSQVLRTYGLTNYVISEEDDHKNRERKISDFRAGRVSATVTVDIFNEGVDVPDVDMLVFMRATHSRRIFVQQLGRGLRISPNKDRVVVLDFVSDLRRLIAVLDLDRAARAGSVERLGLGDRIVDFTNESAGSFLREWILDQVSLDRPEDEYTLDPPRFDFPDWTTPNAP